MNEKLKIVKNTDCTSRIVIRDLAGALLPLDDVLSIKLVIKSDPTQSAAASITKTLAAGGLEVISDGNIDVFFLEADTTSMSPETDWYFAVEVVGAAGNRLETKTPKGGFSRVELLGSMIAPT